MFDQWRLWTFVCHPHTRFLTVAGNHFKVKVKSTTKFQFDSILTCESCQRSCTALSGFIRHCGEKERNAQIDEWCRPFFNNHDDSPQIVFLTINLKFALRQLFRKQSWKYENYFWVLCENQCCCLCCLPDAYCCIRSINHFTQFVICISLMNMQRIW